MKPAPPDLQPGQLRPGVFVVNRYRLDERIDVGAFGEVWRAADLRVGGKKAVALKFLRVSAAEDDDAVARFERELSALSSLNHPNVVEVVDTGTFKERRFIALRFINGDSLASWLNAQRGKGKAPRVSTVLSIFAQICDGLAAAHRLEDPIVHRDLKPQNVMIERDFKGEYRVHLLDFGVARLGEGTQSTAGDVIGTPPYMSPEQAMTSTQEVGPWSDVFALGVLLIQMLTLQKTPVADNLYWWQLANKREHEVPNHIRQLVTNAPELIPILERALQRRVTARHRDAAELLQSLIETGLVPGYSCSEEDTTLQRRKVATQRPARPKPGPSHLGLSAPVPRGAPSGDVGAHGRSRSHDGIRVTSAVRTADEVDAPTTIQPVSERMQKEVDARHLQAGAHSFAEDDDDVDAPTRVWDGQEDVEVDVEAAIADAKARHAARSVRPPAKDSARTRIEPVTADARNRQRSSDPVQVGGAGQGTANGTQSLGAASFGTGALGHPAPYAGPRPGPMNPSMGSPTSGPSSGAAAPLPPPQASHPGSGRFPLVLVMALVAFVLLAGALILLLSVQLSGVG